MAVVLIVGGILGLVYGKFSFTKETHDVKLGPLQLSVKEEPTLNVPAWAGVGASGRRAPAVLARAELAPASEPPNLSVWRTRLRKPLNSNR